MHTSYIRSDSGNQIFILNTDHHTLRCRQRCRNMDGSKVKPLKFISFKEMNYFKKKYDCKVFDLDYHIHSKL
jgi:hypothetical protein